MNTRWDATVNSLDLSRQFIGFERDVLILSVAMFAFSLSFQMISRYVPEYLRVLGAGATVVGLYGSTGNLIRVLYPYPGGALSDRFGPRLLLTLFGTLSSVGFPFWFAVPQVPEVTLVDVSLEPWLWIFVGLFLTQVWKPFGLDAAFATVKQSVPSERLATRFASTEIFRRIGFLLGPLIAAALLTATAAFVEGFRYVLIVAVAFGIVATVVQHLLYDAGEDLLGRSFKGLAQFRDDLRPLPETLRSLLVTDTPIRFANGMVYVFFVIAVTEFPEVGFIGFSVSLRPGTFFSVLLDVEMVVALLTKFPVSKLAERTGFKPVVALGFSVYAMFPVPLIFMPADQWVAIILFTFSGLRFAGLPAHKALIVDPAERNAGGRVTGAYYLLRNIIVIPSAALGGWPYARSPTFAFSVVSSIGAVGVVYFVLRGEEFAVYAGGA